MKRLIVAIVLILILACTSICVSFCSTTFYYALVPTALYKEADFSSEILANVPKNQVLTDVEKVDDNWWRVTVYGKTGYMDNSAIYETTTNWQGKYTTMRVNAGGFSQAVNVYYYPTTDSAVYTTLKDNVKLEVAVGGVDYGEYTEIKLDNNKYYIMSEDLTTGLTYSQIVAIILGVIGGILVIALVFLLIYGFRLKLR